MLAGVLVVPLAGCDLLPSSTPVARTPAPPTADEVLVDRVTSEVTKVRDTAASLPGAESLVVLHDAHLSALGASTSTASPTASPSAAATDLPTPGTATVGDLRAAERALEATLTDAAVRAEDGGLARLLASMSAAVAQQLALFPSAKAAR